MRQVIQEAEALPFGFEGVVPPMSKRPYTGG